MVGLLRRRWRWVMVMAGAVVAVVATVAIVTGASDEGPGPLDDLERASEAGESAQGSSRAITENLERIAANLRAGSDLAERSDEIRDLTAKQRESLRQLAEILRSQLDALKRTSEALAGTRSAITGVTRLSRRQERLLDEALAALQSLESFAAEASATSQRFAHRARYGARLAEDSRDAFSGP